MKTNDLNLKAEPHPLLLGVTAARANFVPGLLVQAAMASMVLAYYFSEPARLWLGQLADIKLRFGYFFSFISSAIAGGIMPEILKIVVFQRGRIRRENWSGLLFGICFWGTSAMIVDSFYRLQATMFGSRIDFATVSTKVFVDQFVYNPIWAAPWGVTAFEWKNQGYRFAGLSRAFTGGFYKEKTLPALVATWGVWIPVVSMV